MDSGAWQATVHGCHQELDTTERLGLSLQVLVVAHGIFDLHCGIQTLGCWPVRFSSLTKD